MPQPQQYRPAPSYAPQRPPQRPAQPQPLTDAQLIARAADRLVGAVELVGADLSKRLSELAAEVAKLRTGVGR